MTALGSKRPVMIAVLGTHSTGKSTFLARLAQDLRREHVRVATVASLGERARDIGLPTLSNHSWASTLWIITRGISNEIEAWVRADVVLVDRATPDALGYYRAALEYRHERGDANELAYLEALVRGHSRCYDLTFRTTLDRAVSLGNTKVRDTDSKFRVLADRHIDLVLHELGLPHEPLPADGHDRALSQATAFIAARVSRFRR